MKWSKGWSYIYVACYLGKILSSFKLGLWFIALRLTFDKIDYGILLEVTFFWPRPIIVWEQQDDGTRLEVSRSYWK